MAMLRHQRCCSRRREKTMGKVWCAVRQMSSFEVELKRQHWKWMCFVSIFPIIVLIRVHMDKYLTFPLRCTLLFIKCLNTDMRNKKIPSDSRFYYHIINVSAGINFNFWTRNATTRFTLILSWAKYKIQSNILLKGLTFPIIEFLIISKGDFS